MNIFFLAGKPGRCARWHCDKHVVKMILESTQILQTAHWIHKSNLPEKAPICITTGKRGQKHHAPKHPSVIWGAEALPHYIWLCWLALALVKEHEQRFKPKERHACAVHLEWLLANPPPALIAHLKWIRDPPPAMPDEFKVEGDSIQSQKNYQNGSKRERGLLKWSRRHVPHWARI